MEEQKKEKAKKIEGIGKWKIKWKREKNRAEKSLQQTWDRIGIKYISVVIISRWEF